MNNAPELMKQYPDGMPVSLAIEVFDVQGDLDAFREWSGQREAAAYKAGAERLADEVKKYPIKENQFGNRRAGDVIFQLDPEKNDGSYWKTLSRIVDRCLSTITTNANKEKE